MRSRRRSSARPLMVGNKVVLLQDGPATYQAMFAAIRGAQGPHQPRDLHHRGRRGRAGSSPLRSIDKQAQGVQVNLIYDSVGAIGTPPEFFKRLTDARRPVLEFNPVNPLTATKGLGGQPARPPQAADRRRPDRVPRRHQHQQRLLGRLVRHGSKRQRRRRARRGATPTCRWKGPVVAEFQKLFLATWEKQKGEAARAAELSSRSQRAGQGGRARHRQLARRAVQPDLRDADLRHRQRGDQRVPDQRLLRPRPAAARRARGRRAARRRREADPAEPHRFLAGVPRRALPLRRPAARPA